MRPMATEPDEPRPSSVEHDGFTVGALDWGGDGPPLVLLHPTGFCAGVFDPLARALRADHRVVGVDVRGHGTSSTPTRFDDCSFAGAAGDVVAMLDHLGLGEVAILGESLGGAAGILVDRLQPGRVRKLLLCEPIAVADAGSGQMGEHSMSATARRRRAVWADRAAVRTSYGGRPPLDVLEPAALDSYVRWGFRDRPDGQVELACPPEVEAWFFERAAWSDGAPAAFAHLASLTADATIVCGDGSGLPHAMFAAQAARAGVDLVTVPGTHLFLQEDTARATALVREHVTP